MSELDPTRPNPEMNREHWGPPPPQTPPPLPAGWNEPPREVRDGPAWEWRARLGTIRAAWMTVKEVLGQPSETFRLARCEGGIGTPVFFFLLMLIGTALLSIPLSMMQLQRTVSIVLEGQFGGQAAPLPGPLKMLLASKMMMALIMGVVVLVLTPISGLITLFVTSGLAHLGLSLFGGARRGFETTLRATAYSYGACTPFTLIPLVGGLIFLIYWSVVMVIALIKMQETDAWRVILGLTVPGLILILLGAGLTALIAFLVMHSSLGTA